MVSWHMGKNGFCKVLTTNALTEKTKKKSKNAVNVMVFSFSFCNAV